MVKNFKLTIQYDGSLYHGWQRQNGLRTIQGEIENAIAKMTGQKISLQGSGRTDAQVHAIGQVANFTCETDLSAEVFRKGINSLVQEDIVITACRLVHDTFHARFDAKSKTYHYRILNRELPSPICRQYAWFLRKSLDIAAIRSAIPHLVGTHDFKAFEGAGSPRCHTVRQVMQADFITRPSGYCIFKIEADGFLRYMVRNIVGTLIAVGRGKITPDGFKQVLTSRDRGRGGVTAPAHGLFLMKVTY
ncbi:MAG: tRNA pseudouridine(38-40) synthase TruA [Desulfobacterales bacterium]|nr:tRNA pseudouridine(38-40) synthase TruA [Desulfobacterales bacterium]